MNDFIGIVQWSAISILLFFSGFQLAAQVVGNNKAWIDVDWSLQLLCWILSFLIYHIGEVFMHTSSKRRTRAC